MNNLPNCKLCGSEPYREDRPPHSPDFFACSNEECPLNFSSFSSEQWTKLNAKPEIPELLRVFADIKDVISNLQPDSNPIEVIKDIEALLKEGKG